MPRLYLFAEGTTELTFSDTVLKPHLASFGVYLHPPGPYCAREEKGENPSRRGTKVRSDEE